MWEENVAGDVVSNCSGARDAHVNIITGMIWLVGTIIAATVKLALMIMFFGIPRMERGHVIGVQRIGMSGKVLTQ